MRTVKGEARRVETSPPRGAEPGHRGGGLASLYPKRRSRVRARIVDEEMVILDREQQVVHQLNETASYIWERCDGHHTVTAIADELAQAFDVDVESAEKDVADAVRQLETAGLVEARAG